MSVNRKYPEYVILVNPNTLQPYIASGGSGGSSVNILDESSNPINSGNPFPVTAVVTSLPNVTVAALPSLPAGSNQIGSVAVTSLPSLPAGANLIGAVTGSGVFNVRPAAPAAGDYLPVRLSNGTSFYTASGGSGGTVDQGAAGVDPWLVTGAVTVSGTVAATQSGTWNVTVNTALPAGNNNIGDVDVVSLPSLPAGSNVIGAVTQSGAWSVSVSGTVAVTQSGGWTVTANAGTGTMSVAQTNAATADYDTDAGTVTQMMMGIALPAAGGPVAGGTATNPLVVSVSNTPAVTVSGTVTVTGTVAATQSGTWTVNQGGTWTVGLSNTSTADYDTGGGTVTQVMVGLALPASGGPVAAPGDSTNGLKVNVTNSTVAVTQSGTWNVGLNTGSNVIGAVTQSGTWTVQQGGAPWSVSGTVAVSGTVTVAQTNMATADYDSGAGTVTQTMIGLAFPASGGPVAAPGDTTNGLKVNVTNSTLAATQSGTWNVGLSTGSNTIGKVDQGTGGASAWKVDGSAVTQPVSGTVSVSGTVTVAGSGTFTTAQTNAATADYDTGAGTVTQVMFGIALPASGGPVAGGTATNPIRVDPTGTTAQPITDNGGSLTVDGTVGVSGTVTVAGAAAHGASISGNPVRSGGRAVNVEVTAVTNGQTADLVTDLVGKLIVLPFANPENLLSGATGDIVDTTSTQVIAAQAASVRIYVTSLLVQNSHATVGTWVNIKDGSTTLHTVYAASGGGGARLNFSSALKGTAATALNAVCETTGANVRVSASGYKGV